MRAGVKNQAQGSNGDFQSLPIRVVDPRHAEPSGQLPVTHAQLVP
jgi:hypothetical protein